MLGILAEGSAAASGLADRLAVRRPSITALIDGLVARGLVDRRQEDTDRRRVELRLTPEGVSTLAGADAAVDEYLIAIAGHLPDKEEAMALRSLELWARAMVESRQGPRACHRRRARRRRRSPRHAATGHADEQDRGQARGHAGRRADRRKRPGRHRGGGHPGGQTVRLPLAAYVPWGPRALRRAQGHHRPDRSKWWIKRATPIVMRTSCSGSAR